MTDDFFTYEVLHPREAPMTDMPVNVSNLEEPSLADRLAAMADTMLEGTAWDHEVATLREAIEALREKDAEIGRLKNHHEATIAQTDRVLRKKDRRIAELEDALRAIDTDTHNVVDATLNGIGGTNDE